MKHAILIIGGSDGLGLAIGKRLRDQKGNQAAVYVTGRDSSKVRNERDITFLRLDIGHDQSLIGLQLDQILSQIEYPLSTVVYAAGFNQLGHISMLRDEEIITQINVTMLTFALLIRRVVTRETSLEHLIVISSTSQLRARELEPVYAGGKAGLAHLAHSIALGSQRIIKHTLTVLVSGMNTKIQQARGIGTEGLLTPEVVAESIQKILGKPLGTYQEYLILRNPLRIRKRRL